ncbi:MAG: metallophosphoesterase [Candidatus Pacearchaeota archaeon]|jgi:hypothetical protein
MKISKKALEKVEIRYLQDALFIDNSILVLGDLHIGYEENITKSGIFPRIQFKEIIEKLNSIFWNLAMEGKKVKKVIILGDLKHEFSKISEAEWSETLKLLDYLDEKVIKTKINDKNSSVNNFKKIENERIILVKGNHDNILGPIAKKREVKLVDYYIYKGIGFMHGNKLYKSCFEKSRVLILGHLHPAITLCDNYKREKYKCFLKGNFEKKEVYIIPSFSPISFGYDLKNLKKSKHDKGFLFINDINLEKFNVIIYNKRERKEYNFGKLKKLLK